MIYSNATAVPREELAAVIKQGSGANKLNIWNRILPAYGVGQKRGHLVQMSIAGAEMMRIMDKVIEPGGDIERIQLSFEDSTYTLAIRKEEVEIPDEVEKDYDDYFSTEAVATQMGEDKLELTHEYLVANAIMNTTTFGAATNSAVAYTVANLATISFIADIDAAIEAGRDKGEIYNTIILSRRVYQRIRQATLVLLYIRGQLAPSKEVTDATIQQAFADQGIEKVLIGSSQYNSAASGATPVLTRIWPDTYIWVGRTADSFSSSEDGLETVSGVGASLFWDKYGETMVQTYRHEPHESNIVRAKTSRVPYIANANCGVLIATQFA